MNDALINEAMAILQTMNMEDCAAEIQKLRNELERVKGIAGRRLDKIVNLQQDVAVLEDKLEDTRSELKYEKGVSAHQRSLAGQLALELAQLEDDPRRLEATDDDAEIEASLERIRDLDELGREPRSHLKNELADAQARIADLEKLADNRLERIMHLLGAIDAKDFDTIQRDNELAAEVDPEQAREYKAFLNRIDADEELEDHGGLWGSFCRGELD